MCKESLFGQLGLYCKKLRASRTNRIVMHRHVLRVSLRCCFIHRCLDKSDRISKRLIACRTNRIVMHRNVPVALKRCCIITCCLDKSYRIGIETCYVFHCAAVPSSVIFGTAVLLVLYWSIAPKLSSQIWHWHVSNWHVSMDYDTICPTGCQLFAIRFDLFRQRCMKQQRSEASSTCIFIVLLAVRFVLLLKTVFLYDMIGPGSCQTCP